MVLLLSLCIALALVTAALSARALMEAFCCPSLPRDLPVDRGGSATEDRVDDLLRAVLDEAEYGMLAARGHLDVVSPANAARVYRIPRYGGLVTVYEQGRAMVDLCLQPERPLPSGDVVVLHKLMIQASESDYLAIARQHPTMNPSRRYRR
jgi:hypothetical protein